MPIQNAKTRRWIYISLLVLYLLHNDFWNWDSARVVAFLPIGLLYHVIYCLAASVLLFLLVKLAWPRSIDQLEESDQE